MIHSESPDSLQTTNSWVSICREFGVLFFVLLFNVEKKKIICTMWNMYLHNMQRFYISERKRLSRRSWVSLLKKKVATERARIFASSNQRLRNETRTESLISELLQSPIRFSAFQEPQGTENISGRGTSCIDDWPALRLADSHGSVSG